MNRRLPTPLTLILGAVALFLSGCAGSPKPDSKGEAAKAEKPAEAGEAMPDTVTLGTAAMAEAGIATWTVQTVDLEHLLLLNGAVEHDENRFLQLASNVRGRVAAIPVDLGARVRRGDPVLVLESVDLARAREEYLKETAGLRVASRVYDRAKLLIAEKAISASEFQAREGDYQMKKASAQVAERALHLFGDSQEQIEILQQSIVSDGNPHQGERPQITIRAPFDGQITERKVAPGTLVEALQPLLTLTNLSSVWVFLQAYEKDMALLKNGLPVTIRSEAYPQETFKGRVDFLGSIVEPTTRTVRVRATVNNPGEKLRPGMFIRAQVDVPKPDGEAKKILAVPQSALQTLEGRTTIFIQIKPGVFVRRAVETGHTFEGFTEVLAGIRVGDLVVTEGSFVLKSEFARASLAEGD